MNKEEPPTRELSHLISAGENLYFSSFNHEGTGVKLRITNSSVSALNDAAQKKLITFAIRKKPFIRYDTYYSYFLDANNEWKFYGAKNTIRI